MYYIAVYIDLNPLMRRIYEITEFGFGVTHKCYLREFVFKSPSFHICRIGTHYNIKRPMGIDFVNIALYSPSVKTLSDRKHQHNRFSGAVL